METPRQRGDLRQKTTNMSDSGWAVDYVTRLNEALVTCAAANAQWIIEEKMFYSFWITSCNLQVMSQSPAPRAKQIEL